MKIKGTTIICTKKNNQVAIGGDGQATFGDTVLKQSVSKIKRLYNDTIISGMAGSTADAFNLYEKFEAKLQKYQGIITRAAIEMARDWRTDKILRKLEAMMIVANKDHILLISGSGDVIEPDEPMIAIGSGGNYALSAGKALYYNTNLSAKEIVKKSLEIAGDICIYTNQNHTIETIG
ncbi:MAG: HslU--HslV peptidase proteolytic subunit [Legionellales bacterium]|jgi:ATP-dependent HslUV protease subunit HslV|nr:HslU--HslV peptidase proteolytic subunit [Legionellales bacterium]OUX65037.1 MAG: HslU--HslV peptidase proteolytic subunit [Gammaproteobacteria bacterium TMED281]|tara:strand:+ start:618 stop:1151 length:534 start_codon:yes stop_codon:yes gene_type:complete